MYPLQQVALQEQVSDALDSLVVTTIDQTSSLEVIKVADIVDNGDGVTGVGDIVQYTITVENTEV
jgi:hypothetical protein